MSYSTARLSDPNPEFQGWIIRKQTNSIEQSPLSEANSNSAGQEHPTPLLQNPKVHYRVHKSPPLVTIQSQLNPIDTLICYLLMIYFNNFPSMPKSRDSSACIATSLRTERSGFYGSISDLGWEFFLTTAFTQHPIKWVSGGSFPGTKATGAWSWSLTSI
jgi:hypothetical protein